MSLSRMFKLFSITLLAFRTTLEPVADIETLRKSIFVVGNLSLIQESIIERYEARCH